MSSNTTEITKTTSRLPNSTTSNKLLTLGGYGLFVYGVYNLIMLLVIGGSGSDVVLGRIRQIVSLFPVLYLGPVLIFSSNDLDTSRNSRSIWLKIIRFFPLLMSICYFSFVPLLFFHQYLSTSSDINVVSRLEASLKSRKVEIMNSIAALNNTQEFTLRLSKYPEISNINIDSSQSPAMIRRGIATGIDKGIEAEINRLINQQQVRAKEFKLVVRTASLGSLVSGFAFLALTCHIMTSIQSAGTAIKRTAVGLGNDLTKGTKAIRSAKRNPLLRLFRSLKIEATRIIRQLFAKKRTRNSRRSLSKPDISTNNKRGQNSSRSRK